MKTKTPQSCPSGSARCPNTSAGSITGWSVTATSKTCSHPAAALYLLLVTAGDAMGLSYYSDASIIKRLSMDPATLAGARENLIRIGLIAWRKPLYQVLSLDGPHPEKRPQAGKGKTSFPCRDPQKSRGRVPHDRL